MDALRVAGDIIGNIGWGWVVPVVSFLFLAAKRVKDRWNGGEGSPESRKYWEKRLNTDLGRLSSVEDVEISRSLIERAVVAQNYLNAFGAIKLMGADGRRTNWAYFSFFLVLALILMALSASAVLIGFAIFCMFFFSGCCADIRRPKAKVFICACVSIRIWAPATGKLKPMDNNCNL